MIHKALLIFFLNAMPLAILQAASLPGSEPLTSAFAERLIVEELQKLGRKGGFDVVVDKPRLPMGNQERVSTRIVLDGLRLDESSGRFSAFLVGTVDTTPRFHLALEGRVRSLVSVAVLSRTVRRGERVTAHDLDWIELADDQLPKAALVDPDHIIGTEARRRLKPGRVLTNSDLGPPRLVRRGQAVRVIYADGDLRLTALGKARDDGAFGEPVRVLNAESNLQVLGIATGPDEVTVGHSIMPGTGT